MRLSTLIIIILFFWTSISSATVFQKARVTAKVYYASIETSESLVDDIEFEIRYSHYGLRQKPICKIFYNGTEITYDSKVLQACEFDALEGCAGRNCERGNGHKYWQFELLSKPISEATQLSEPLKTKFLNLYKSTGGTNINMGWPWDDGIIRNPFTTTLDLFDDVNPESFKVEITLHPSADI